MHIFPTISFFELFALCGLAHIVTSSYLFAPIRNNAPTAQLRYMLSCAQCMGFWAGAIYTLIVSFAIPENAAFVSYLLVIPVVIFGGFVSLGAVIINNIIELLYYSKLYFVVMMDEQAMKNMEQSKKQQL